MWLLAVYSNGAQQQQKYDHQVKVSSMYSLQDSCTMNDIKIKRLPNYERNDYVSRTEKQKQIYVENGS